ncbi:MAG: type II secretion system protein [Phycisphaeraceae bacterium]|nr:type II secretion system protein [Phycisphaerae bacterium]MBX3392101.1 type II secretion system protein [Phycisphaeraceae bacterium]HRJ48898.1 type II secretion system protein [Phycisphaerales bacterium]
MGSFNRTVGRRGFTIAEVLVSIGVIAILFAVFLPSLRGAWGSARSLRSLALVRSSLALVHAYAEHHQEIYPIASAGLNESMLAWQRPLVRLGYLPSEESADPEGFAAVGGNRVCLSGALLHPPELMVPDATVPIPYAKSSPIRLSGVVFPSSKGAMVQWLGVENGEHVFWTWEPWNPPARPVAMADGSVVTARCTDYALDHEFFENWVGNPVISTWQGCRGLDRRVIP